ncbi:MAG: four helix bundle protein [Selenomonadales bacterium]|nr:four helix bundle protein [Selenomonadales bacterium]
MTGGHETLLVWQKAHAFVLDAYKITANFPRDELYGLTSQIRRAAVSVPTNIAEGKNRGSDADYARFLYISRASCGELEYLLLLAKDLGLLPEQEYRRLDAEARTVSRMLNGLLKALASPPTVVPRAGARRLAAGSKSNRRMVTNEE